MRVRPVIKYVRGQDPERSLEDPALALLASEGWSVGAWMVVEAPGPNGPETQLMLILWPPSSQQTAMTRFSSPSLPVVAAVSSGLGFFLPLLIAIAIYSL
jgi:hypothetical protein